MPPPCCHAHHPALSASCPLWRVLSRVLLLMALAWGHSSLDTWLPLQLGLNPPLTLDKGHLGGFLGLGDHEYVSLKISVRFSQTPWGDIAPWEHMLWGECRGAWLVCMDFSDKSLIGNWQFFSGGAAFLYTVLHPRQHLPLSAFWLTLCNLPGAVSMAAEFLFFY